MSQVFLGYGRPASATIWYWSKMLDILFTWHIVNFLRGFFKGGRGRGIYANPLHEQRARGKDTYSGLKLMIIDLSQIKQEPKTYYLSLPPQWWQEDVPGDQIIGLYERVEARLTIEKVGKRYRVRGNLATVLRLRCDRCLESYPKPLNAKFHLFLETMSGHGVAQPEVELAHEEMGVDLLPGEEVDLGDIIKEQIYLSIPMKTLCHDGCLGLCPICGVNRNREGCACHIGGGHPAFQQLRKLL